MIKFETLICAAEKFSIFISCRDANLYIFGANCRRKIKTAPKTYCYSCALYGNASDRLSAAGLIKDVALGAVRSCIPLMPEYFRRL